MATDPAVISSIEQLVAAQPLNTALRLHLVELLLSAERWDDALDQCTRLLEQVPDDRSALGAAVVAAEGCGNKTRAGAYRRLLAGLSPGTEAGGPVAAPLADAGPPSQAPDDEYDEYDEFLRQIVAEQRGVDAPVTLADVGGLDEVKKRLHTSFLGPMRNEELRKAYGKSLRGGLLLYGPPGCGKTFLARAVAGELGAHFIAVGLHEVLDMWLGKSERNLHAVFESARRHTPCVLFLDEVDALGMKRSNLTHSAGRNVVVQLLNELDSTRDDNEGVFILGATNQPWDLDPALRRPGRFDRMLLVLPPDEDARTAIIERCLRDRPVKGIDARRFARATEGRSGADLRLLCEAAAERALEDSLTSGVPRPIDNRDMEQALAGVPASTRSWFEVARNFATFANQDGTYDDLIAYMRRHRLL